MTPSDPPRGLRAVESPVTGLAVAERRVDDPVAKLICVHGGLDRGGSFARLARRVERFDVIAYDRRGYQGSRASGPAALDRHIEDLVALASIEASHRPVMVFGHSFGGVVSFGAALRDPSLFTQVINFEAPLPWVLARDHRRVDPDTDPSEEAERFFKRMVSVETWERLSEAERDSRRLDGAALVADLAVLNQPEPFHVADIAVPTIYAFGNWARAPYYRQLTALLHSLNPLIEGVELPDAGHGAHLSHPDQLARLIERAWNDLCASA